MWWLRGLWREETGAAWEWLLVAAIGAALAVAAVSQLLPAVRNAHGTVVNRVTNLTGSGF
jgi:Flp pilus assembly pilin Flp